MVCLIVLVPLFLNAIVFKYIELFSDVQQKPKN